MLELGEVPLTIFAQKNVLKNWVRIVNKIQCNSTNINSHEKAVLHNFSWAVRIEIMISEIGMQELFLMKDNHKSLGCKIYFTKNLFLKSIRKMAN